MKEKEALRKYHLQKIAKLTDKLKIWDDELLAQYPHLGNLLRNMKPIGWGKEAMDDVKDILNAFTTPHMKRRNQRIKALIVAYGQTPYERLREKMSLKV